MLSLLPEGRVHDAFRGGTLAQAQGWKAAVTDVRSFALVEPPVPCDWAHETDSVLNRVGE